MSACRRSAAARSLRCRRLLSSCSPYTASVKRTVCPSRGTRKRNAKGSPAAARRSLSSRDSSLIPGLNSHVPCAPDFSLSPVCAGVKSR